MEKTANTVIRVIAALIIIIAAVLPNEVIGHGETSKGAVTPILMPDSRIIVNGLDIALDDFNRAIVDWEIGGGSAEAAGTAGTPPYNSFEGTRSLTVHAEGNKITLTGDCTADISKASYYSATVWIPRGSDGAELTVQLNGQRGSYSGKASLIGGSWQTVCFDISDSGLQGKNVSVNITLSGIEPGSDAVFDLIGASSDAELEDRLRYFSPYYTDAGGETEDSFPVIRLNGGEKTIEAAEPAVTDFSEGYGIKVRLRNRSTCRTVKLEYTTRAEPGYEGTIYTSSKTVNGSDGETVTCTFPVYKTEIESFRLIFGEGTGEIEIESITASRCCVPEKNIGKIDECMIRSDRKSISIHGSFDKSTAEKYAGHTVYLYELPISGSTEDIGQTSKTVAQTVSVNGEFSFSVELSEDQTEIFRKYAVMVYSGENGTGDGTLIPVSSACAVTNPEILSDRKNAYDPQTVKGIYPALDSSLLDGVGVTAVEVRLDKLLTLSDGEELDGGICRISPGYLSKIDSQMKQYSNNGIGVYFILRLEMPDSQPLRDILAARNYSGNGFCAFNVQTADGVNALGRSVVFLAERYASDSGVTSNLCGITVGSTVNDAYRHYNNGQMTVAEFAKEYSAAFRTVYNAAKSVCAGLDVCIPLGGVWNCFTANSEKMSFDASSCIEAVASCLSAEGNIGWTLSYDICAGDDGIFGFSDTSPSVTPDAYRITSANLEVLSGFLSGDGLLYNGAPREAVLIETEPHGNGDGNGLIRFSAEYIFTYLRISSRRFSYIKAYIPAHPADYMDTLSLVDTQKLRELTESYFSELVGSKRCAELLSEAVDAERRNIVISDSTELPVDVKGKKVLFSFEDGTDGFVQTAGCSDLRYGTTFGSRSGLLTLKVDGSDGGGCRQYGMIRRFGESYDFSHAGYVTAEVRAAALPYGTDKVGVVMAVFSGKSCCVSRTVIDSGEWVPITCDLTGFKYAGSCDGMAIYICSADGEEIGQPTLLTDSIYVMSSELSDDDIGDSLTGIRDGTEQTVLLSVVILLGAVMAVSASIFVTRIANRHKKEPQ